MNKLAEIEKEQIRKTNIEFRPGDTIKVYFKIIEGEKERTQAFQGVVIKLKKGQNRTTFTLRKVSYGVGVERIFPLHSPFVEKIQLISRGKVRRARLYYLREKKGKAAKIKDLRETQPLVATEA